MITILRTKQNIKYESEVIPIVTGVLGKSPKVKGLEDLEIRRQVGTV